MNEVAKIERKRKLLVLFYKKKKFHKSQSLSFGFLNFCIVVEWSCSKLFEFERYVRVRKQLLFGSTKATHNIHANKKKNMTKGIFEVQR